MDAVGKAGIEALSETFGDGDGKGEESLAFLASVNVFFVEVAIFVKGFGECFEAGDEIGPFAGLQKGWKSSQKWQNEFWM
jgi:hypothetical protein